MARLTNGQVYARLYAHQHNKSSGNIYSITLNGELMGQSFDFAGLEEKKQELIKSLGLKMDCGVWRNEKGDVLKEDCSVNPDRINL